MKKKMMTMTTNKGMLRMAALVTCLLMVLTALLPLAMAAEDIDSRELGASVILEDPELIGDIEDEETSVTENPTQEPTTPPTNPPNASFDIQMEPPSGWYASRAVMEMTINDVGGTGWNSVRVTMARSSGTVTLIDGSLPSGHIWIDLLDNCVVEVVITDPSGEKHSKKVTVNCFDKGNPSLTASVSGEYLNIEAKDSESGIAAIYVNGTMYTELSDGKLKLWLKEYADAYEQLIVQAVDKVGNVSQAIAVANPFYKNKATPTPTKTPTKAPTATPKPTAKPTSNSGSSSSGGSSATSTPTQTPTPTPIADSTVGVLPTPTAAIETGFPFSQSGNSFTRDLLYDKYTNKQFIAIETRNGDVFYIIIDYDKPLDDKGERYETYFLNLVDSRDMLDIVGETKTPEPEVIYVTPEPTVQPTQAPAEVEPEKKDSGSSSMLGIIGILAIAGGGAFWYFKIRKPSGGKSKASFDDYDYEDDDDEDDDPVENKDE